MTVGRIGTYVVILGVSLSLAAWLGRRHTGRASPAAPSARVAMRAPVPTPDPAATSELPRREPEQPAPVSSEDAPAATQVLSEALCPSDMAWVGGATCAVAIRRCQKRRGEVCEVFETAPCRTGQRLRFCMDRHEYPNLPGMRPATLVTFVQARTACEAEGKRLCSEVEWALACEGTTGFGYPYGNELRETACNVGRDVPVLRPDELWEPRNVSRAVARVDARTPAGSHSGCKSPFGVEDLTGNLEEWVASDSEGFDRALRGGEYTQAAPTCRTVRQMRDPSFRSFNTGFRCCRDPLVTPSRPSSGGTTAK